MSGLAGQPILTAAQMRAAEAATGETAATLMERAGIGIAQWVARLASGAPVLVLCGPGNNGGDGYVAAQLLRSGGVNVTVAALGKPRTHAACAAAGSWQGPTTALAHAQSAPVVLDALFGTGDVRRPDESELLSDLSAEARLRVAVDLPSGLDADLAVAPNLLSMSDVTLALGALKPAHLLQPGASYCGHVKLIDLGLAAQSDPVVGVIEEPRFEPPNASTHKYNRGRVTVIAGAMPGASILCATAALRAGAGYVSLDGAEHPGGPAALVHRGFDPAGVREQATGAIVVGPGLGRDQVARTKLAAARQAPSYLVIDGDALRLIDPDRLPWHCVLTPHAGEFDAVFGAGPGSKIDRTRAAAARAGCIVVHKGADTVVAAPDGRVRVNSSGSNWLATAGSGDVLAGTIASRLAGLGNFSARGLGTRRWAGDSQALDNDMRWLLGAACDGVWMHQQAARLLGGGFIADDLADALSLVQAAAQ